MEEKNRQPEVTIGGNALVGKKKKKWGVWIIDIIIIAVLAVAVAYAVNRDRHKHEDVIQKEMLQYLEERYGEKFELVEDSYRGTDYAHSFVSAEARPKAFPDEQHTFQIQGYFNRWGGLEYFDGYVMVKLLPEYESYIDDIIGQYFDEYKFYMEFYSEWLTNNLPPDTKLEDLKNYSANADYPLPELILYLPPQVIDEPILKKMIEMLSANYYRGGIGIKVYKSLELYDTKKRNDWNGDPYEAVKVYSAIIYQDGSIKYYMD